MEELEQAIATVKAFPKPGITYYFKKMQAAQGASAEMMPGFAFAKKAGRKNAEDFKAIDIGNFEKMLPEVERLQRKVRMYFGDDPKVKLILQELEREVEGKKTEIATAKSLALKVGLGSAVAIVVLYIIMIASSGV